MKGKYLNDFLEYAKKLFKKWFIYIGFLPTFYDYVSIYLPQYFSNFQFPNLVKYIFLILFFIVASFSIWLEEKKEKEKILNDFEQYKNGLPNYEVKLILKKYQFEEVEKFKIKKKEILNKALKQLEVLKDEKRLDILKCYEIKDLFDFPLNYKYDLEKYALDLENFIEKLKSLEVDESIEKIKLYKATPDFRDKKVEKQKCPKIHTFRA